MTFSVSTPTSVRLRAILASGLVFGLGTVGTLAAWSTSSTTTSGQFLTGSVDITVNGTEGAPTPATITLPAGNILPGRSTAALVNVRNAGTLPFTYIPTATTAEGGLGANLTTTVRAGATTGTTAGATVTSATSGLTCTGGNSSVLGTSRPIAVGATEPFCVQFDLASGTPNNFQGVSSNVTFTFAATGVASG